eukprot:595196-Amphidinium_carterae.1
MGDISESKDGNLVNQAMDLIVNTIPRPKVDVRNMLGLYHQVLGFLFLVESRIAHCSLLVLSRSQSYTSPQTS